MSIEVREKREDMVYDCIQTALYNKEGFIYLKKRIDPIEPFPFDKLYGVICDISDHTLKTSGIPNELILRTDLNLKGPNTSFKSSSQVAYFSPEDYGTKENVLTVIKLFNTLSSFNITIYITKEIHSYVNTFSNDNINFCCYENVEELTITASIIITYGYCTRRFIQQKIPTIVIGPFGLGGWVTPENLEYLLKESFRGRPSGRLNEIIPLEILVDEFLEIRETKGVSVILNKNLKLLDNYLNSSPIVKMDHCINHFKKIHDQLHDISQSQFLRLKLASNVFTVKNGNMTFVQREMLNDLLFSLPESDIQLLEDLNSDITCEQLQKKNELNAEEFWDIVMPLWERKAIIFQNEIS